MGQYPDGLWGPLIIEDPDPPFEYDEEIILTLSDWYHEQIPDLVNKYQSQGGEAADGVPTPSGGALMNSGKNITIPVKPNTTYLIRVICPASYPGHAWYFDQHNQTTVEVDGVYVKPATPNSDGYLTRIAPGQRQAVLITTKNDTSQNYAIFDTMDVNMLFINKGIIPPPLDYNTNVTGWLVYNESAPLPDPPVFHQLGNANFFDDLNYEPLDEQPLLEPVDHQFVLETNSANVSDISRFTVNNYSYLGQKVPSLYTALTTGEDSSNPIVYGQVNPIVVRHNEIVEIVINNLNTNLHPWHMHGHQFQFLDRPDPNYGQFNGTYRDGFPHKVPVRRDTVMLQDNSWAVIRFKADNPGVWLLHCHIELHVVSGFIATIIEAPEVLCAQEHRIPQDHIDACKAYPMDYEGNAAGNTDDYLNVTGANTQIPSFNYGAMYPPGTPAQYRQRKA
jgi:iron transport multicopper oxidase